MWIIYIVLIGGNKLTTEQNVRVTTDNLNNDGCTLENLLHSPSEFEGMLFVWLAYDTRLY